MRTPVACAVMLSALLLEAFALAEEPGAAGSATPTPPPSAPRAEEPEQASDPSFVGSEDSPMAPSAEAPRAPSAPSPRPGELGGPCRSRWHCRGQLRCYARVCVEDWVLPSGDEERRPPRGANAASWALRPYLGGTIGGALPAMRTNWAAWAAAGPQASLRGGLSLEPQNLDGPVFQLQVDVGLTRLYGRHRDLPSTLIESTITAAVLVPIGPRAWWVLRGGGGGALSRGEWSMEFGEVRGDVIAVLIRTSEHLQVEFAAPSFRYLVGSRRAPLLGPSDPSATPKAMTWVTSLAVDYVF
jgi:hypothetical protein